MKEVFPEELAKTIAAKGIAVAPTLVMMKAFTRSGQFGYKESHYPNAEAAVKLLHQCGVTILAGTDANSASYVPAVDYGETLHYEMQLLTKAGLTPIEVLAAVTSKSADAFGFPAGRIAPGQPATMALVDGRPDIRITDSTRIVQIWVNGKLIL